jgi:hypothetical protein
MIRFVLILMQLCGFIPPSGVQPAQGTPRYPLITVENAHQLAVAAIVRSADFTGENDFRSGAQFAFSPDSTMLAVALNYDVGLADALTGEVVGTMEKKEGLARHRSFGLYFSPDGSLLASAGDGWVTLWNVDDHVGVFSDHADYQHTFRYSVTISPDNQFLYLYSADFSQRNNVLHVWDIGRQREVDRTEFCAVYVLRGYEALCDTDVSTPGFAFVDLTTFGTVSILPVSETRFRLDRYALSPDGRLFAFYFLYVENEQPVNMYYLLDLDTQEIIQRRAVTYLADSYAAPVGRFTINPSGELLIYQDGDLMKLVDATTGDVLISFASQRSWNYNYVQFSPDGTLLALGDFPQDVIDIYAVAECYVTSDRVVNLRSGPGTEFDDPYTMEPGKRLAVRDQLQDGEYTWYHLAMGLWVRGDVVETHGSC